MISFPFHQKGLSLVELLISMLLGLILTAGALQMMLASQEIYQATDTLSRIQENGRFALNFLAKDIRMAGHNTSENAQGKAFWDGACGATDPCTANGAAVGDSDQIGILMDPSNDLDCIGNALGGEDTVIANVYYVDDSPADPLISSLYCRGFDLAANNWISAGQPLVDGVENMQILYGVTDPAANNTITNYISADAVHILANADPESWGEIGAVRISLLLNNGQARGNGNNQQHLFDLLDAPTFDVTDQHNRQVFSTTITINNIIYQSQDSNQ